MAGLGYSFFADSDDLQQLVRCFDSQERWHWIARQGELNAEQVISNSASIILDGLPKVYEFSLGKSKSGRFFYLQDRASTPVFELIDRRDIVGFQWGFEELFNPNAVGLLMGGVFAEGHLSSCWLNTMADAEGARTAFNEIVKLIKSFSVVKGRRAVLPGAKRFLDSGGEFHLVS